jgi:non-ribosomal peptide synthetase component F
LAAACKNLPGWILKASGDLEASGSLQAPGSPESFGRQELSETVSISETVTADDLACITFTSGSTGAPAGILGCHGSLAHFASWQERRFGLGAGDQFSLLSGLAHDPLQRDLFTPLQLGATLHIPDPDDFGFPLRLVDWLARTRITCANLTPAMARMLIGSLPAEPSGHHLPALGHAFFIGEALGSDVVLDLRTLAPAASCINLYGATESQRALGYWEIGADDPLPDDPVLPLGRGIDGVHLLVLWRRGEPGAAGHPGHCPPLRYLLGGGFPTAFLHPTDRGRARRGPGRRTAQST